MIVDAYTHIWESPEQLGRSVDHVLTRSALPKNQLDAERRFLSESIPTAAASRHLAACEHADKAIVVGFKSHYMQANVPNAYVADYVQQHADKMIGFAGVDPSQPDEAIDEIDESKMRLGLQGIAVAPAAQNFHPSSTGALRVYSRINEMKLPLLFHQGIYFSSRSKLEYARPVLLDEIARDFPDLKIIIAHMGYPWIDETIVMLEKHMNVFSDVSGLLTQPWRAYNALLSAYQYGVMDKLLFASGFPFTSATECIEALYGVNQICQGTSLPVIPREQLRGIVQRPTLELLGIEDAGRKGSAGSSAHLLVGEEESN